MKTRKILSLLLAVTMLLTAFSVAGLSVSAAEITAPGAGYVLSEETVVSSFVNGTSTGGLASYNRTTVDANFPGLSTAPLFYGEFLTAADPAKSQDIFRYFSTSG
ncbi:MAG: hypothetical protein IJP14_05310, partial [Clostridia bacterium]|nr:hypothetical protein [Clostridia bacterium]